MKIKVKTYPYQNAYDDIFDTESGRNTFEATRQAVATFEKEFTSDEVIKAVTNILGCSDAWEVLNSLDHLVTLAELRELTNRDEVVGQDRIYRFVGR